MGARVYNMCSIKCDMYDSIGLLNEFESFGIYQ